MSNEKRIRKVQKLTILESVDVIEYSMNLIGKLLKIFKYFLIESMKEFDNMKFCKHK